MEYNTEYVSHYINKKICEASKNKHLSNNNLSYSVLDGGIVLPRNQRNEGGIYCEEYLPSSWIYRKDAGYSFDETEIIDSTNNNAIYIGFLSNVWGHLITDCLKFMWFLKSEEYNQKFKDYKLIYISTTDEIENNFLQLLNLADIDSSNFIRITKLTKFNRIILPDECFFLEGTELTGVYKYTKEYTLMIDEIMSKVNTYEHKKYEKVYLTRSRFNQKDIGEVKLENYFRSKGYDVIAPERYSLLEQLRIYKSIKHFVSTDGSISHNAIFMNRNVDGIILLRGPYVTMYQFAINEARNLKITYIESHLSLFLNKTAPQFGPNFYYVSENLLKYFNDSIMLNKRSYWYYNFKDFEIYLCKGLEYAVDDRVIDRLYYEKAKSLYNRYLTEKDNNIILFIVLELMTRISHKIKFRFIF